MDGEWKIVKARGDPDLDDMYIRRVARGGNVGQDLPPGHKSVLMIGQTSAGKSTIGNLLVCGDPNDGPFAVGESFLSETTRVQTVWSEQAKAYITDTPGLFENRDDSEVMDRKRKSNNHMRAITHFLHEDGGHLILMLPSLTVTRQLRGLFEALWLCCPSWPFHTMVVCRDYNKARVERVKSELSRQGLLPDGGTSEEARQAIADEHDRVALQDLNRALKDLGVEFGFFTTFCLNKPFFSEHRLVERVQDFLEVMPLQPKSVQRWATFSEDLERKEDWGVGILEKASRKMLDQLEEVVEKKQEWHKELQKTAGKQSWMYAPAVAVPLVGWAAIPFIKKYIEGLKAEASELGSEVVERKRCMLEVEMKSEEQRERLIDEMRKQIQRVEELIGDP